MDPSPRRSILGRLAALLALPFVASRSEAAQAVLSRVQESPKGSGHARPTLAPPAHSVKRRG